MKYYFYETHTANILPFFLKKKKYIYQHEYIKLVLFKEEALDYQQGISNINGGILARGKNWVLNQPSFIGD